MRKILITTDQAADVPAGYERIENFKVLNLAYEINGIKYDNFLNKQLDKIQIKKLMHKGVYPKILNGNLNEAEIFFSKIINEGYDIIHLSSISENSQNYNFVQNAIKNISHNEINLIQRVHRDYKIKNIDTGLFSGGLTLLVDKTLNFLKNEYEPDFFDVCEKIEYFNSNIIGYFIFDKYKEMKKIFPSIKKSKKIYRYENKEIIETSHNVSADNLLKLLKKYEKEDFFSSFYISHSLNDKKYQKIENLIINEYGSIIRYSDFIGPFLLPYALNGSFMLFVYKQN